MAISAADPPRCDAELRRASVTRSRPASTPRHLLLTLRPPTGPGRSFRSSSRLPDCERTISGLIVLVTLPLIPLFMWLIGGRPARGRATLGVLQRLGGYFLDVIQGTRDASSVWPGGDQSERIRTVTGLQATDGNAANRFPVRHGSRVCCPAWPRPLSQRRSVSGWWPEA